MNRVLFYYNGAFFSFFIAENSGSISETGLIIARVLMAKIRYSHPLVNAVPYSTDVYYAVF